VAIRAKLKGWELPSVSALTTGGGYHIIQGQLPAEGASQYINLHVGADDGGSAYDNLHLEVYTPDTLEEVFVRWGHAAMLGRGVVVVFGEYVPERVADAYKRAIESTTGDSWKEVGFRLARLATWEAEGLGEWDNRAEEFRPFEGPEPVVREVRLPAADQPGQRFSVPASVVFSSTQNDDPISVQMLVQDPKWVRERYGGRDVLPGAGLIFAGDLDPQRIADDLNREIQGLGAPSWSLLRLALEGLGELIVE
jgi:hypothetical protein